MKKMFNSRMCRIVIVFLPIMILIHACSSDSISDVAPSPTPGDAVGYDYMQLNRLVTFSEAGFEPQLHAEGTRLIACTTEGLYAKDLTQKNSKWELFGFGGIAIQDYVRNGKEIIALCQKKVGDVLHQFLLLSKDEGKTWEDYTPESFKTGSYCPPIRIAQCPTDKMKLLVCSNSFGMWLSEDFGSSWNCVIDESHALGNLKGLGFHPTDKNCFYRSGEGWALNGLYDITFDNGKTWKSEMCSFLGDNSIHHIAFSTKYPNTWLYGGEGIACKSTDGGKTWNMLNWWNDRSEMSQYWYHTLFDTESNRVFMIGSNIIDNPRPQRYTRIAWSDDYGDSWNVAKDFDNEGLWKGNCLSVVQDKYNLYILTEDDVIRIAKQAIK